MAITLNASTSSGFIQSADTSGEINLQSNGSTVLGLTSTGATVTGTQSVSGNLSFNSGYGSSAVAYGCRAWVNFNGTGTVAIRASGNVTSITDNAVGKYTVNFTNSMPDANYAVSAILNGNTGTGSGAFDANGLWGANTRATGSCAVEFYTVGTGFVDSALCDVAIFR